MIATIGLVVVYFQIGLMLAFFSDLIWKMDQNLWLSRVLQLIFFPLCSLVGIVGSGEVPGQQVAAIVVGERRSMVVYVAVMTVIWPYRVWVAVAYVPAVFVVLCCAWIALSGFTIAQLLLMFFRGMWQKRVVYHHDIREAQSEVDEYLRQNRLE